MITTEDEYKLAMATLSDLGKQYKNLSGIDRKRPYIGQQMQRDIFRLTSEAKQWENDRSKSTSELIPD